MNWRYGGRVLALESQTLRACRHPMVDWPAVAARPLPRRGSGAEGAGRQGARSRSCWRRASEQRDVGARCIDDPERLRAQASERMKLAPAEWKSGEITWLIDMAGEPRALAPTLRKLDETAFANKQVYVGPEIQRGRSRFYAWGYFETHEQRWSCGMKWLARIAVLTVGLYAIYYFAFPTYTHRFRLTFQVEVDGKVKEGTGVITVTDQDNQWVPLSQNRWKRRTRGLSRWLDLGKRDSRLAINNHVLTDYEPRPYPAGMLLFVASFKAKHRSLNISGRTVRDIVPNRKTAARMERRSESIWLPASWYPLSAILVPS